MTEQQDVKAGAEPVSANRGITEILADPRVEPAVAPVREAILEAKEFAEEMTLTVERRRIREVCESFKRAGYTYLVDICGVDMQGYPGHSGDLRFAVIYHLYSFDLNTRVRLKVRVADGVKVPSVSGVWKTANWPERETYDMYGILFEGHPNLERILTWEGFNGYPLRKDFPVRGIDTGARIYPEVFPAGGGPKEGSTGKDPKDVHLYEGEWTAFGVSPAARIPAPKPAAKPAVAAPKPAAAPKAAAAAAPAPAPAAPPKPKTVADLDAEIATLEKRIAEAKAERERLAPAPAAPAAIPPGKPVAEALALPTSDAAVSEALNPRPDDASVQPQATAAAAAPAPAPPAPAVTGASAGDCPWHDEKLSIEERMAMARGKGLKDELFAAMAQTDCGACGWDCEGYAAAIASGETTELDLCVPGEAETEDAVKKALAAAGKA